MFFVNYLREFLYQPLKLSNVRPTDFANSKYAQILSITNAKFKLNFYFMICRKKNQNVSSHQRGIYLSPTNTKHTIK